ncbi:MAG: S-layer family protein [Microcoleus sp. SIO2G3]|nr:S-layer family protein [Microcoleus sp. SIO2G3]
MRPKSWLGQYWQLGLVGSLTLAVFRGVTNRVYAQIIPDDTLGAEPSVVKPLAPNVPIDQISGGVTHGSNLFHSFEQFNVGEQRAVYFTNPAGIENILSRVTGGNRSEILGKLGVSGNADLFLINPNGIIFGPNATLEVYGSFVATTANAVEFGNQGFFSASNPNVPPVLTVNPSALLFNQIAASSITNQSTTGLQVRADQSLLLVGGDVQLQGGQLQAQGGRVELGGVAGAGTLGLSVDGNNLKLSYPAGVQRANVSLTNGATIFASNGGDIYLSGGRVTLSNGSEIVANTLGLEPGGTLTVTASASLELTGGSRLLTQTEGAGAAGDLTIETEQLIVQDGSQVGAGTFSEGEGGTLKVTASDSIQVIGTLADGQIASGLFTQTEDVGAAGDLIIETRQLIVQDGGQISASAFGEGEGGTLAVTASEFVQMSGTTANGNPSGLFAVAQGGSGDAGELKIETRQLIVQDGAQVSASTSEGAQGRGGILTVTASKSIELRGTSADGQLRSGLLVGTTGAEAAGDLTIKTARLIVLDGAVVSAGTLNEGLGGTLTITASDSVELSGISANGQFRSSLLTQAFGAGNAGNLNISTAQLIVQDGAEVTVSSQGLGNAGSLAVDANSIVLENQGSLRGETASGLGGNITLDVQDLILMRDGSAITTTAANNGSGGNITINSPFIIAIPSENSDIVANADQGFGGRIDITATGIYGLEFREELTRKSDINASSNVTGQDGIVEINTPEIDPSRGLTNLPTDLVDASNQIAQNCRTAGTQVARNEFIITGRGGLPDDPREVLSTDTVWTDLLTLDAPANNLTEDVQNRRTQRQVSRSQDTRIDNNGNNKTTSLVEAQGWVVDNFGIVTLIASAPMLNPYSPPLTPASCRTGRTEDLHSLK